MTTRSTVYKTSRMGGAVAEYYAEQTAWAYLPAPAQRFIAALDKRMGKRRQRLAPRRGDDPFDDDPNLVMPAYRIARVVDDRSGSGSRPVAATEIANAVDGDRVVRPWMIDVIRTSRANPADVVAVVIELWIEFGQTLHDDPWFRVIGIEDPTTGTNTTWRTERRALCAPAGPLRLVTDVLGADFGGRIIANVDELVVAVPKFDIELLPIDTHGVLARTIVGGRHANRDHLQRLVEVVSEGRHLGAHLTVEPAQYKWVARFDTTIDTHDSSPDSIRTELWAFLQIAHELHETFEP